MKRILVRLGVLLAIVAASPRGTAAQVVGAPPFEREAGDATAAALVHLFTTDSLAVIAWSNAIETWPSAKALAARRAGAVAIAGISTRMRQGPERAIALVERAVPVLNDRGIQLRTVTRASTNGYCTSASVCTLPADLSLVIYVGYGLGSATSENRHVAHVSLMTDSAVRPGAPILSLDVHMERVNGVWRVASINRTRGAS